MHRRFIGRPKLFNDPQQLVELYSNYLNDHFKYVIDEKTGEEREICIRPISILGFCNFMGISRETLCQYQKDPNFSDTIKNIKDTIEEWVADQLLTNPRTAGVQFILKNCFKDNWQDKVITENVNKNINSTLDIKFIDEDDVEDVE